MVVETGAIAREHDEALVGLKERDSEFFLEREHKMGMEILVNAGRETAGKTTGKGDFIYLKGGADVQE